MSELQRFLEKFNDVLLDLSYNDSERIDSVVKSYGTDDLDWADYNELAGKIIEPWEFTNEFSDIDLDDPDIQNFLEDAGRVESLKDLYYKYGLLEGVNGSVISLIDLIDKEGY